MERNLNFLPYECVDISEPKACLSAFSFCTSRGIFYNNIRDFHKLSKVPQLVNQQSRDERERDSMMQSVPYYHS